jgi:hypothetical protein
LSASQQAISSVVSFFDLVPVEIAAGFHLLCSFKLAQTLGLTVGKTIGVGTLIVLFTFDPFAGCPKIDQFSHSSPRR